MLKNEEIKAEMLVHVSMNTHKEPKKVLLLKGNEYYKNELAKYDVEVICSDSFNQEDIFDIVIYNDTIIDDFFNAELKRVLEPKCGIFVCHTVNYQDDSSYIKKQLITLGKSFWICMPYKFEQMCAIISSHKYHPQADIILDRSDFIDANYYNTEIQNASFVMPSYIQKALTGVAKR